MSNFMQILFFEMAFCHQPIHAHTIVRQALRPEPRDIRLRVDPLSSEHAVSTRHTHATHLCPLEISLSSCVPLGVPCKALASLKQCSARDTRASAGVAKCTSVHSHGHCVVA
jgi:hypothetical protein